MPLVAAISPYFDLTHPDPTHEIEIDHPTKDYAPYSFRRVRGFFNVPQIMRLLGTSVVRWDLWFIVLISEKPRKSNCLHLKGNTFLLSHTKTLSVGLAKC